VRVLVVEDNETNRFAAREMLRGEGCEVAEARDGLAGCARAGSERFDLVLMDISMPRLDGLEATRRIRAGGGLSRDVPIVALTAHALPEERQRVREAGMQDLLIKPLRQAHLQGLLRRLREGALGGDDDAPPDRREAALEPAGPQPDAARGEGDDGILDRAVLDELAALLEEAELRRRLETFREEMRALPADLAGIWRRGGLAAVRERAHSANGSAALFGAVRLNDVLGTLEEACTDEEPEFVGPLIEEVETAVDATEKALLGLARNGAVPDISLSPVAFACDPEASRGAAPPHGPGASSTPAHRSRATG
jgi:CheY-like chemotaxis protein